MDELAISRLSRIYVLLDLAFRTNNINVVFPRYLHFLMKLQLQITCNLKNKEKNGLHPPRLAL